MDQLHPDAIRMLKEQHECLADTRRALRAAVEAADKHIEILLRILNGCAGQRELDHVTRKYVRACRELGEIVDQYMKSYVVEKKEPNPPTSGGTAA